MYVTNRAHVDRVGRAHREVFGEVRPAATMVIVAGLIDPAIADRGGTGGVCR